jgi:hypothetical protein
MKAKITLIAIASSFLLVGCATQHGTTLTSVQAKTMAQQLANDEAFTRYGCRPFDDGQAPRFELGHWVWSDRHGYGNGDLEALVMLAADGSTHEVDITVLNNVLLR